jgi:serine/threonine protein kinase
LALAPGTRLGPYEIVAPLGAGGMGEVYRARDTKLSRDVAIKVLPPHLSDRPESLARFEREAKAVAALSHPNILAIFDFGTHEGTAYAAMELLEGSTLRDRLATGPLPPRKAAEIGQQIAQGLAAAHEKGIVHRDLKPENLFLTKDGQVKVLDFGLARQGVAAATESDESPTRSRHTDPGMVVGTAGYMSPEQVRGAPLDHRSDIFSFGAVLYEMVSGRRAFQRDTPAETMTAILREDPPEMGALVEGLPGTLGGIIQHCLEKQVEERFQSARDLAFDLASLARGTSASGSGPSVDAGRGSLLRRLGWPALALVAVVAAFGAGRRGAHPAADRRELMPTSFVQLTDSPGVESRPNLSPDGKSLLYVSSASGKSDIYLLRVGGRNPVNLTADSGAEDMHPSFSPDGESIAFHSERAGGGIFIMGSTGESVRRLTDFGQHPSWSPDGKEIAVSTASFIFPTDRSGIGSHIKVIDVQTGRARDVTAVGDALQPQWSPHGLRIAYWGLRGESGQRDIWTVRADGSEAKTGGVDVTKDAPLDWCPVWSPDGRFLYFASDRGGSMNLWRIPIDEASGKVLGDPQPMMLPANWSGSFSLSKDGRRIAFETLDWRSTLQRVAFDPVAEKVVGPPLPIVRSTQPMRDHEISPDGQWVAFTRAGTREDLFVARIDGSQYRRLTDDIFRDRGPAWSPDGSEIVFYSDRSGVYDIWAIRPDGSGLHPVTHVEHAANFPVWSPDGSRLIYSSVSGTGAVVELAMGGGTASKELPAIGPSLRFWPFSWSSDGRRLAGIAVEREGRVAGLEAYSFADQKYTPFDDDRRGYFRWTRWLSDGERLLVRDLQGISIFDTRSRKSKRLLSVGGYAVGKSVGATKDDRWITYTDTAGEGDIWLATLE